MHENFTKFAEDSRGTVCSKMNDFRRELLFQKASSTNKVANATELMALKYTEISNGHLMGPIASLGKLLAVNSRTDSEEIEKMKKKLEEDCMKSIEEIKIIVERRVAGFEEHIQNCMNPIDAALRDLPCSSDQEDPLLKAEELKAEAEVRQANRTLRMQLTLILKKLIIDRNQFLTLIRS